jgi:hypothetical protein
MRPAKKKQKKNAGEKTEKQQEPQMATKPKDAAAADEKNQATASYSACEKKTDLSPGRN